ncbi:dCTP deaminase domain-containing protein [Actinomycetospora sp. CA-101289]|uniref:dCTP deaminase domain-containing protein n=1 Tax=Actinomycetospora sp. CA-101289 TaxID=3239893 RepID=UPI003D9695C6
MFLLSDEQVLRQVEQGTIRINPFEKKQLLSTCYYFRLGQHVTVRHRSGNEIVDLMRTSATVEPGELTIIRSYESFELSESHMGLLGATTRLGVEKSLLLLHGPTIDPSYQGPLDLALLNVGQTNVELTFQMSIGKIHFLNIADSGLAKDHRIVTLQARIERMASEARE